MMGREIRRVPVGWEHPVDPDPNPRWPANDWDWTGQGRHFLPMHERFPYDEAEIEEGLRDGWLDPDKPNYGIDVMPDWPAAEADHFQMYETVSEGTPVSPVFSSLVELTRWLVHEKGYSEAAAVAFVRKGWAPSFVGVGGQLHENLEGLAALEAAKDA
jgi:hypothetical protein